jgi:hypothetical protein
VRNGDSVITINPRTLKSTVAKVKNHFVVHSSSTNNGVLKITVRSNQPDNNQSDCSSLTVTGDHLLLTETRGWIEAQHLDQRTDRLVFASTAVVSKPNEANTTEAQDIPTVHCAPVSIVSIAPQKPTLVCDFETDSVDHSFIANGLVSHNCQVCVFFFLFSAYAHLFDLFIC